MLTNKKRLGVLAAVFFALAASASLAQARMDPLREVKAQIKNPNMLIILDTSGSMRLDSAGNNNLDTGADDPNSRLYIAKDVLKGVITDMGNIVNFGFMSYWQTYKRDMGATNKGYYLYQQTSTTPTTVEIYYDYNWLRHHPTSSEGTPQWAWGGVGTGPRNFTRNGITYTLKSSNNSRFRRGHRWNRTNHTYNPSECWRHHETVYCTFSGYTWVYEGTYYTYTTYNVTSTSCYVNDFKGEMWTDTGNICGAGTTAQWVYPNFSCWGSSSGHCCAYPSPSGASSDCYRQDPTTSQQIYSGTAGYDCNDHGLLLVPISTAPADQPEKINQINQYLQTMDNGGLISGGWTPIGRVLNRGDSGTANICKSGGGSAGATCTDCLNWDDAYHYFNDTVIPADAASQDGCRKNFVLLVTDGQPYGTGEPNNSYNAATSIYNNLGIKVYVVGFGSLPSSAKTVINTIASNGGTTQAYFSENRDQLNIQIRAIINEAARGDYATAPPSYTFASGGTGTVVFFSSAQYPEWNGHLRAVNAANSQLLWDAGARLSTRVTSRNIYTSDPANTPAYPIAFTDANPNNLAALRALGLGASDDEAKAIIYFMHGTGRSWPLGDIVNSAPATLVPPPWRQLSAFNYQPFFDTYGYQEISGQWIPKRNIVVFTGANDGMFHTFTMESITSGGTTYNSGDELWAYIPPNLIPRLKELYLNNGQIPAVDEHLYYVAASPKIEDICVDTSSPEDGICDIWKTALICGEGPGGSHAFMLDVTHPSPTDPNYDASAPFTVLWTTSNTANTGLRTDVNKLGETFSNPAFGKIRYLNASSVEVSEDAILMASGYDDINPGNVAHGGVGTTVYILRTKDGTAVQSFNAGDAPGGVITEYSVLANTVAYGYGSMFGWSNQVSGVDTWQLSDILQADLGGKIWTAVTSASTNKATWTMTVSYDAGSGQPFYYSPAMATVPISSGGSTVNINILAAISGAYNDADMDPYGAGSGFNPKVFLLQDDAGTITDFPGFPKTIDNFQSTVGGANFPSRTRPVGSPLIAIDDNSNSDPSDDFVAVILTLFIPPDQSTDPCSYGEGYVLIIRISGLYDNGVAGATVEEAYAAKVADSMPSPPFIVRGALVMTSSGHGTASASITTIGDVGTVVTTQGDAKFLYWKEVR